MKQPVSGRERPVGDTVHDGTPQVTVLADTKAQDNRGILAHVVTALGGRPVHGTAALAVQAWTVLAGEAAARGRTRS